MSSSRNIIIVNSDDFGLSDTVNEATVRAFEDESISSTTLMATMAGFEDAVEKANTLPILKNAIGMHLNLTQGVPASEPIKKNSLFCKDGQFCYDRKKSLFFLSPDDKNAVRIEIEAQLKRIIDNHILPTHLDGHHHVHTEFAIAGIYAQVGKEYGIRKMRITKNVGKTSAAKTLYKNIFNAYLTSICGMKTTDIFCGANEYKNIAGTPIVAEKNIEIMVHAKLNDANEVVDLDGTNMADKMKPLLEGIKIVSYYSL